MKQRNESQLQTSSSQFQHFSFQHFSFYPMFSVLTYVDAVVCSKKLQINHPRAHAGAGEGACCRHRYSAGEDPKSRLQNASELQKAIIEAAA